MKKLLPLILPALLMFNSLTAAPITPQGAQTVALNFFIIGAPANVNTGSLTATLKYTRKEPNGSVDYYIFDIAPAKGFVIVSGDNTVEPIIAYSYESNFSMDVNGKTGLSDWMNTTAQKINAAVLQNVQADNNITKAWSYYAQGIAPPAVRATSVVPLVTTTWNQEPYYNIFCPYNSTDKLNAVTGCVATAMAQIMKYWNFPAQGSGSYSYTDAPPAFTNNYGVQSANFGATAYNWAGMPLAVTGASNDTLVARLMYHCGVSVAMSYGDDNQGGSGAWVFQSEAGAGNPCAQMAYATYFSYNAATMQGLHQSSYTASAWITLLKNELNAGRPVEYEGWAKQGGHTWVCDGYDVNSNFHMNWGWGGVDNGYYSLSKLNPSPYLFNSNDGALIGIQPSNSCGTPTGLASSAVTTNSANIGWGAVSGATSYNLQYQTSGSSTWTTVVGLTTNSYAFTNLSQATTYNFEVQTVCTNGPSGYSGASSFTTQNSCGTPSGLGSSAVTTTGATVSWGSVSGATSYSLQYKTSAATTWTTVSGLTTTSYGLTGLASGTTYNYQVQATCAAGPSIYSSIASFTTTSAAVSYCTSKGSTTYEYVKTVTIGSFTNTSASNGGYGNFTASIVSLAPGAKTITLTPGFAGTKYREYWAVYIDYNKNGLFTDAGEKVFTANGTAAVTGSFTVPAGLSGSTLIRVVMEYGTSPASCGTYSYGETEDYTGNLSATSLTIDNNDGSTSVTVADDVQALSVYPNPVHDLLNITLSPVDANTQVKVEVVNITGQVVMTYLPADGELETRLDVSSLANGVYMLRTLYGTDRVSVEKVIKQ